MDLRSTLNLPDPNFTIPMKADLALREPEILERWAREGLYHRIQDSRKDAPTFVLHDGPPYTNSPIHLGTALNKILKDFVVKSRTMMGFRAPYVPGFDNHGLPIEQTVAKKLAERKIQPDVVELRRACRAHAQEFIDVQRAQFQRLGVLGLWEKPYSTMAFRYEAEMVRVFKRLVEGGFIYRGLRPTLWSPTSQTALADTEIVYQDHTSKAIYVRFPLIHDEEGWSQGLENVYTIIWTTTPWTIPANLAVAFHPALEYGVVHVHGVHYVVAMALLERVAEALGWDSYQVDRIIAGVSLEKSIFRHPIFHRDSLGVLADYVTTEDGTGVVHTAPGHGREDFMTGALYGLPVLSPVDGRGILTHEAGEFEGVSYKDCDRVVVDRLQEVGNLLKVSDYAHSYPHAERDGKPVIFRATEQWFLSMEANDLRSQMLDQVERVQWLPESGKSRITAMIAGRPDWCISRQRPWGVGVPVLYAMPSNTPVLDPLVIERIAQLHEVEGSDCWFAREPKDFLPEGYAHPVTGETEFRKESDILDVWFDSGCTHLCVLEGNVEPEWKENLPADLYLEGSDQHRGWFNTSLILSTSLRGEAPYRTVLTHGFVVDENGVKQSKRLGNVIDPVEASAKFGADILRYWVGSVDWTNDAPCYPKLLERMGEGYRRIRNTLRFLLGNLYDFMPDGQPPSLDIDRWVVEQADLLVADAIDGYAGYDFGRVLNGVHNFCVNELSAFYLDAIKDRMYCDGKDWDSRRSGQRACYAVLVRLVKLIAPILPFTCEEVWARVPGVEAGSSIHVERFEAPSPERLQEIEGSDLSARFARLLDLRGAIFAQFERAERGDEMKDSQNVVVELVTDADRAAFLRSFGVELPTLLKFSWLDIREADGVDLDVVFRPSPYLRCERSRLRRPDVEEVNGVPLTRRDRQVLGYA